MPQFIMASPNSECHSSFDRALINALIPLISSILNCLLSCQIAEFVFFFQMKPHRGPYCSMPRMDGELLLKEVQELVNSLGTVELIRSEGNVFIIRSNGCTINSYKMWWNEGERYRRVVY